jgi:hypothetical protein
MAMDHGKWMATLAAKLLESVPEAKTNGLGETYVRAVVEETIQHGQHVAVVPGTLEGKALDGLLCASEWRYGLVARSSPYQDMGRPAPAGGVLVIELLLGRPGRGAAAVLIAHARDIAKARNLKYLALQPADSCQEGVSKATTCKYCNRKESLLTYYARYGFVGVPYALPTMHDLFPCPGAGCDYCRRNAQVCMTMVALVDAGGLLEASLDADWASCAQTALACKSCPSRSGGTKKKARRADGTHRTDSPQPQAQARPPPHLFTSPPPHLQHMRREVNGSPRLRTQDPWTRSGLPRPMPNWDTAYMRATPGAGFSSDRH